MTADALNQRQVGGARVLYVEAVGGGGRVDGRLLPATASLHCEQASACYRRAAADYHDLSGRHNEAACLTHLGQASQSAGDIDGAGAAWLAALSILDQLAHPDATAVRAALTTL